MRIFSIAAIFIYTLLFSIIGAVCIAFSIRKETFDIIIGLIDSLLHMDNLRIWMFATGFLLILLNISIAQFSIGKLRKNRTIALENKYGRVKISLSTIEDYIKRLLHGVTEVKKKKINISNRKHRIEVIIKAVFYSDVNISEVTKRIQNTIQLRLQEILGIEEAVIITVQVIKIVQRKGVAAEKDVIEENPVSGFKGQIEYGD